MYWCIKNLKETTSIEKANQLLQDDWVLIDIYTSRDGLCYVLGKKRESNCK